MAEKLDVKAAVDALLEKGKKEGFISIKEVKEIFKSESDEFESFLERVQKADIDVVDEDDLVDFTVEGGLSDLEGLDIDADDLEADEDVKDLEYEYQKSKIFHLYIKRG